MTPVETIAEGISLYPGDCLDVLAVMEPDSIDSCVTDPPYHLTSIVKRFGKTSQADHTDTSQRARQGADGFAVFSRGFMGKTWDGGDVAFRVETWAAVFRVLKPGAHLIAFSGTRTYHRMACAIEDAGFEVRDQIGWVYGSGFPKSHNAGNGWGTALKPAWEPMILARKPLIGTVAQNVLQHGTGALNIDGCRVEAGDQEKLAANRDREKHTDIRGGKFIGGTPGGIVLNSKPGNGRWPANVIHDGSAEVMAAFPDAPGQLFASTSAPRKTGNVYGDAKGPRTDMPPRDNGGSAARFFYTAKADADDRLGSKHPTVKPVDLMQYLVRLVTPKGGIVLDPFAGTGTTGEAAFREGMRAALIEREEEYQADIRRRMSLVLGGPKERARAGMKASGKVESADALPLFGGVA